jgi:hypothetical protein
VLDVPIIAVFAFMAFVATFHPMVVVILSRLFGHTERATVSVGSGPQLFTLHLNRTRYCIRTFPGFDSVQTEESRSMGAGFIASGLIGLTLTFGLLIFTVYSARRGSPLPTPDGIVVSEVRQGGAAWEAGIRPGFRLLLLNNRPIRSGDELIDAGGGKRDFLLRAQPPGGKPQTYRLTPRRRPWYKNRNIGIRFTESARSPARETTLRHDLRSAGQRIRREVKAAWAQSPKRHVHRALLQSTNASLIAFLLSAIGMYLTITGITFIVGGSYVIGSRVTPVLLAVLALLRPGLVVVDGVVMVLALALLREKRYAGLVTLGLVIYLLFVVIVPLANGFNIGVFQFIRESRGLGLLWA